MSTSLPNNHSNHGSACPFCDDTQAYRYLADAPLARAVYPKSPTCAYHVLIMPKRHVQCFDELSAAEVGQMFAILQRVVAAGRANIKDFVGYNLLSNNGSEAVNQRVKHCHMHVFLRGGQDTDDPLASRSHTPQPFTEAELQNMRKLQGWLNTLDMQKT